MAAQEVMDNLMIARLEFRAEEDPEVAAHTFKKHITTKVSRRLLDTRSQCKKQPDVISLGFTQ